MENEILLFIKLRLDGRGKRQGEEGIMKRWG